MPTKAAKPRGKITRPARKPGRAPEASGAGRRTTSRRSATTPVADLLRQALQQLERKSTAKDRANLARFGITAYEPYGVSMANVKVIAKQVGPSHALAEALWATRRYEARMLACLVDEPEHVRPAQMDRWCRDFDNWGITDTACFCLFDRVPHAWRKLAPWARLRPEHSRRAAFALLASLALHDKQAPDARFVEGLALIEAAATDERNFVKKGVVWALRGIGLRNAALHVAAVHTARRLAASADRTSRWIGNTSLRELASAAAQRRLAKSKRGGG